jgi:hypothetical protein
MPLGVRPSDRFLPVREDQGGDCHVGDLAAVDWGPKSFPTIENSELD